MEPYQKAFQTLGVAADSSLDEIRHAYRALVRVWHPDRYSDDPVLQQKAQERLKQINEAYRIVRRHLATRRTVELPDSPFRFNPDSVTPRPTTASAAEPLSPKPSPSSTGEAVATSPASIARHPIVLNLFLVILILCSGRLSWARYGLSYQTFTYFLQVMVIPLLCAAVCNTSYGAIQRVRIAYGAAILITGGFIAMDAVMLKNEAPEMVSTPSPREYDEPRTYSPGEPMQRAPGNPPLGSHEPLPNKGPQSPHAPNAPSAPSAPAPVLPSQPVVPHPGK